MSRVIAVSPLKDNVDQRGSWQVTVNGRRKSAHTKKTAAKREARRVANIGDTIQIHRTDGSVQTKKKYQGGSGGSSAPSHAWDVDDIQSDYDGLTDLFE